MELRRCSAAGLVGLLTLLMQWAAAAEGQQEGGPAMAALAASMQRSGSESAGDKSSLELTNSLNGRRRAERRISWCTTSHLESKKCLDWARAIEETNIQFEGREPFQLNLDCALGSDRDQCMSMIDDERSDAMLLDAGEVGVAGRYHSLAPIMVERYASAPGQRAELGHYSVALVRRSSSASLQSLADLFGKRACFSGVSHMASWTLPLAALVDLTQFEIIDCNNIVKSASYFFGPSCAPNALSNKFNPTGDNPQKMSLLCKGAQPSSAPLADHNYNGAFSALKCLAEWRAPLEPASSSWPGPIGGAASRASGAAPLAADVAFLPHNTVFMAERLTLAREARLELPARADLELLCPQGGRAPLERWHSCNFGFAPAHAVVVSSRASPERREAIQRFLKTSVQQFAGSSGALQGPVASSSLSSAHQQQAPKSPQQQQQRPLSPLESQSERAHQDLSAPNSHAPYSSTAASLSASFKLTGSQALASYPSLDVIFSSDMVDLVPLHGVGQTVKGFFSSFPELSSSPSPAPPASNYNYNFYNNPPPSIYSQASQAANFEVRKQADYFEKLRKCPVPAAVLCVTSDKEFAKCQAMSKAFHAAGLKPDLNCKQAQSSLACMQLIKNRDADLVVLDAADIYLAGLKFSLIPIVAEQIEMYDPNHYAVAVAKKSDRTTELFNLKGKLSCHSAYLKGAGWIMPLNFLLSNQAMRKYDQCNSARSAAEHFDKSCAPGILATLSSVQNINSWTIRNMCELCHGTGRGYCARDASEPFYGDTGALRCLVEGGGQVAFMKHTAIFENTGGSNRETWARNLLKSDFELLCRDGSRAPVSDYKSCNLGKVPPNAIATRGDTPFRLIDAYVNLFMYGQHNYGSKYSEEYTFKMFSSFNGEDLIFQDVTQQLVRVPIQNQTYRSYLNNEFLSAMETVFCN